ncbi:fatty acid desaturase [Sodalis ligni]|uniref:fatty acid desaturase n=1 Tax=Sodalis ligni TaxID=2697027 RepID=UPI00193FD1DF|nr:fatty acid desaturase [Sodalis ligni]QWA13438.1 fatty acid desaturase [Sodalis ligni]
MATVKKGASYLHGQQRDFIHGLSQSWLWRSELPTWILIVTIYSGWFAALAYWRILGWVPATLVLTWFTAWYMSLQHELIHGHPTRNPRVNQLLGLLPLAIWYPYGLYRDLHLRHHREEELTLPGEDPETYYFSAERWERLSRRQRGLIRLHNTLPGRVLLGPALDIAQAMVCLIAAFHRRDRRAMGMWLAHGVLLMLVIAWMRYCGFPVLYFLLAVSYPALGLTKIRSFMEHQAADDPKERSVINEAALPWRLLFLNLNYHSVHHDLPGVPWYALRYIYLTYRHSYQLQNRGFVVRGYFEWLSRFLLRPVDVNVHPASFTGEKKPDGPG